MLHCAGVNSSIIIYCVGGALNTLTFTFTFTFTYIGELRGGALLYWRLDAKRPYLLPSSKLRGPRSSRTEGSSSIVLSQIVLWRLTGLLQSAGGLSVAAMTRWSSCLGAVQARCPNKLSQSDLTQPDTGQQVVMLHTVWLVVCLVYGICKIFHRHQVSKATIKLKVYVTLTYFANNVSRITKLL